MKRLALVVVLGSGIFAAAVQACSPEYEYYREDDGGSGGRRDGGGESDADLSGDTAGSTPDLQLLPRALYSGFDGANTFQAPIAVYGAGDDVTVTAADPTVVDIAPTALKDPRGDQGRWFMLTMKKAGATDITASSGGVTVSVPLTVAAYASGRYAVGKARYENAAGAEPACEMCHGGQSGIDHSPAALASAQDPEIETVITTGIKIGGSPIFSVPEHTWTPTQAQLDGLITYLRALPPRNF